MIRGLAAAALCLVPAASAALDLPSGAVRAAESAERFGTYALPVGPWTDAGLPTELLEGRVELTAWHVPGTATTLELLAPLRDRLAAEGYESVFDCATEACGGFDFRYEMRVLPEPEMHVNLGDFRFHAAPARPGDLQTAGTGGPAAAAENAQPGLLPGSDPAAAAAAPGTLAATLDATGRAVLADLSFETGSSRLAAGAFPSLDALAAYMAANPGRRITLVGHTDASGALEPNVALSRARARAVRERLIADYGVDAGRIAADGVGYLMPLAPNVTDEGRALNRRVEAVVTSTD
ncbi:MAG: OmpA family protein [Rhodobacteraceae bacterium]|nr:OmpA family protein [Paracoccaceae bacterium]